MVLPVPEAWSRAARGLRCAAALLATPLPSPSRLQYNDGSTTTTTYLYNSADQLTRETVGETVTTYLYDANGNLTKKDDGTNVHSHAYDFRNLMTGYDGPGTSNDSTYTYDAHGRRITKDVNGTKTAYFHDALNVVAEYNGANQLQRTYVTPGLDQNLTVTASGSTDYYLSDALGSIRQVIDANEATQNSYDYFAFGKVYGSPTENLTQPYRFTGRAWDPESSLYYYRARTYEARLGRLLSPDAALRVQVSAYVYVANAPLTHVDPSGFQPEGGNTPGTFTIGFSRPSGKVANFDITYYPTEQQSRQCCEMKVIQFSRYDGDFRWAFDQHKPWQVDYIGEKPPPAGWRSPIQPHPFYPYQIPWRRDWEGSLFAASPKELYMVDNPGWHGMSPTLRAGTVKGVTCAICTKCQLTGTVLACFTWEVIYSGGKWQNLNDSSGVRPARKGALPEDVVKALEDLGYPFGE